MSALGLLGKGVLFGLVMVLYLTIAVSPSPLGLSQEERLDDSRQADGEVGDERVRRGLKLTKERSLTGPRVHDTLHHRVEHLQRLPQSPVIHKSPRKILKPLDRESSLPLRQKVLTANEETSLSTEKSNGTILHGERSPRLSKKASFQGSCTKQSRVRVLSLPNCANVTVDIGACSGSCFSKQIPNSAAVLHNGIYTFPMNDRCRCCSVRRYEKRKIPLVCVDEDTNMVYSKTVKVAIVRKCQCRTCTAVASGPRS